MSNKAIIDSLKELRKNLRELSEDSKREMCNDTQIRRHAIIFFRESYSSMMKVLLQAIKENKIGSISMLSALQQYLVSAYCQSLIETEDFSDFYELLQRNIKDLEIKIKEFEGRIAKVS